MVSNAFVCNEMVCNVMVCNTLACQTMICNVTACNVVACNGMGEGSLEVALRQYGQMGKAEVGRVREEKEEEERKKMQVREKVEMSPNTAFFPFSMALESRKVGSLKQRVRSHLAR